MSTSNLLQLAMKWMPTSALPRNVLYKLIAELIGRVASFLLMLAAARLLGKEGFGIYNIGLATGFVLAQLGDMGVQTIVSRQVAMEGRTAQSWVVSALWLKGILTLPVIVLLGLAVMNRPLGVQLSFWGLGLAMLGQTFLEFVAYIFRGEQRLELEGALLAGSRLLIAVLGGTVLAMGGGLLGLAISQLVGVGISAGIALWLLQQKWQLSWTNHPSALSRTLWQQAFPLGVATFLSIGYSRLAIFGLEKALNEEAVGLFSASQRLIEPFQIVPASLLAAVFPAYSHALHHNPLRARSLARQTSWLLALLGMMVALFFWLVAPFLIPWLYGSNFQESVTVLQWLAVAIVPMFVNYSLTHYLIAHDQQKWLMGFNAGMFLLHALFLWLFLPSWGLLTPAFSILVAECGLLLACLWLFMRRLPAP